MFFRFKDWDKWNENIIQLNALSIFDRFSQMLKICTNARTSNYRTVKSEVFLLMQESLSLTNALSFFIQIFP